jgi:lysozyme
MSLPRPEGGRIAGLADDPDVRTLIRVLSLNEGRHATCYHDTRGIPTVGIGFNLHRHDAREKLEALGCDYDAVVAGAHALEEDQIDALLETDLCTAISDARQLFPNFDSLSTPRQIVLVDMAFNLGLPRLSGFRKMIAAVIAEDWNRAADEMIDSRWYREVGHRGRRNVEVMRSGALVADYLPRTDTGTATA